MSLMPVVALGGSHGHIDFWPLMLCFAIAGVLFLCVVLTERWWGKP